jgi:hypothetical protein
MAMDKEFELETLLGGTTLDFSLDFAETTISGGNGTQTRSPSLPQKTYISSRP